MSLCDDTLRQLRAINCGSLYGETFEPISEKELTKYELRPIITDFSEYKDCRLYMKRSKEYYQSLELGSRFVLLKNLEYDGGDIRPKGTVAVFVGFCTRLSFFGHEPIPAFSYESEKKVRYIDPACLEAAD